MRTLIPLIRAALAPAYPDDAELQAVCKALCCELLGYDEYVYYLREAVTPAPEALRTLDDALRRLAQGEPLQYVLGHAPFAGADLQVSRAVLIPRPETAGLVAWVTEDDELAYELAPVILDLGTGSGCIAIGLQRALPHARVYACDISEAALAVARRNAAANGAGAVTLFAYDLLAAAPLPADVPAARCLVSNPPYIRRCERADMDMRVTAWEPALALYVPDDDPLLFYRAIARLGLGPALLPGGTILVEVNSAFARDTARLFHLYGYADVRLRDDLYGLPRYVRCKKR